MWRVGLEYRLSTLGTFALFIPMLLGRVSFHAAATIITYHN